MSVVTSAVVVLPCGREQLAPKLGRALLVAQYGEDGVGADECWSPVEDDMAAGSKYPSGAVFWIGFNHIRIDDVLRMLRNDTEFYGTWVWYQDEFSDVPTAVMIGA